MKRILSLAAAAMVLIGTMIVSVSAEDIVVVGDQFKAAYGTPVIDGTLDEVYGESDPYRIQFGKDNAESYSTAVVYWAWDETALYYFADITDDTVSTEADTTNIGDIWKTDCAEVGFNVTPNQEAGDPHNTANSGVFLGALMYGSEMDTYGSLSDCAYVCKTVTTDHGWAMEVCLPIFGEASGLTPKSGDQIAMYTILHNDTDNDNERNSETYRDEVSIGVQYDSSKMDCIVLGEKTVEEVPSPDTAETELPQGEPVENTDAPVSAPKTADNGLVAIASCAMASLAVVFGFKKHR